MGIRRLYSNNYDRYKKLNQIKATKWDAEFIQALEKFKTVNQAKKPMRIQQKSPGAEKP